MHNVWNVRAGTNDGNMYPIRVDLDGVFQLDLQIEWAAILVSFLADPDYCNVTIESRDWQWYHAAWKAELVGAVAYVSSPWHIGHVALSEQSATVVAAKLERAIGAVNEIDSRSTDPLASADRRMNDNLRSVFG